MKNYIKTLLILAAVIACTVSVNAQSVTSAGGAELENADAKVTVTIGEPTIGIIGDDATAEVGFQQAYDSETVSIEETISTLKLAVFPNPTADRVTVTNEKQEKLSYTFYQMDGKTISSGNSSESHLELNLSDKTAGIYFLHFVNSENNTSKTFKIIKK